MIPSATVAPRRSPCPCCRGQRCRRHAAAGRPVPVGSSVTARALAAGLWRLRQAERSAARPRRQDNPPSLLGGLKMKSRGGFGVGKQQSCRSHGNGILDKIECVVDYSSYGNGIGIGIGVGSMEKATKWDYLNYGSNKHKLLGSSSSRRVVALEAALEKARAQMSELEDDRRVVAKKLRKVAEEKAWWKSKARCAAAALREELKMERHHRRQLEVANAKLLKELASAKQRVETERKARELMEEACEELSKEVEEDQAEVEALRRECVAMREEMEEERRMLQMAEVWREERVQMKLSDARAVLEHKYAHLNTLQAEMESFLLRHGHRNHHHKKKDLLLRTMDTRMADAATSVRGANHEFLSYKSPHAPAPEDVDKVFDHFRRKHNAAGTNGDTMATRSSSSGASVASPATDLFLEKVDASSTVDDGGGGGGWAWETPLPHDRSNAACTSSNGNNGGSGVTEGGSVRSRRSGNFNTALIRKLWRSAISESRRKTATAAASSSSSGRNRVVQNGRSPSYSDRDRETPRSSVIGPASQAAAKEMDTRKKKSLMEKLMEARMDDHRADNKPQAAWQLAAINCEAQA